MVKEARKIMKLAGTSAEGKKAFNLMNSMANINFLLTQNVSYFLTEKLSRKYFMNLNASLFLTM
jgi:hypothetical protein